MTDEAQQAVTADGPVLAEGGLAQGQARPEASQGQGHGVVPFANPAYLEMIRDLRQLNAEASNGEADRQIALSGHDPQRPDKDVTVGELLDAIERIYSEMQYYRERSSTFN